MVAEKYILGMVGLGVMGRNLVLNMAEKVKALNEQGKNEFVQAFDNVEDFIDSLEKPKTVMMLVPAGKPVDSVIRDVLPYLSKDDIIIDAGNSYYKDTDTRADMLAKKNIFYLGVGVSGGEHGARYGPSIMPGGPQDAYERVRDIFNAISAHVDEEPCVTWLGPGSAGNQKTSGTETRKLANIAMLPQTRIA